MPGVNSTKEAAESQVDDMDTRSVPDDEQEDVEASLVSLQVMITYQFLISILAARIRR